MTTGVSVPVQTTLRDLRAALDRLGANEVEPLALIASGRRLVITTAVGSPAELPEEEGPEQVSALDTMPLPGQEPLPAFGEEPGPAEDGEGEDEGDGDDGTR